MTRYASIVSTGRFLPEIEVSNDLLRKRFAHLPEFVDKMEASSGIRMPLARARGLGDVRCRPARRPPGARTRRPAPDDVDLIILGTDSPDYITPATSVVLQHKLGAKRAGTFDVGCACASFPTGLAAAAGIIATNPAMKTVLVVGVYLMHKLADADRPDVVLLRRRRRRRGAEAVGPPRVPERGVHCRRLLPQALGHLLGRHLRTGDGEDR